MFVHVAATRCHVAKRRALVENNAALVALNSTAKGIAMAASEKIWVALEDGIKRITINRPERRNAVDTETIALLHEAIQRSAEDASRVVILTGAGDAFCAGADLQISDGRDIREVDVTASLREHTNPTIIAMRELAKPIIAR